jgi:16S rRNA (cytosine1402-N4)-methyltransferase
LENADEPFYELIAEAIKSKIDGKMAIETTLQLKKIITTALESVRPRLTEDDIKKSCQRCFQALRIEVNNEFGALDQFLEKLPDAFTKGGRVAILSFHSGEDRRVKKSFQHFFRSGIYSEIAPSPIQASREECFANRRARSAKLRWATKA